MLEIVMIGEPVLRQAACEVSREKILSQEIQDLIASMKKKLAEAPGVGLAAPQVGYPLQIIVIEDSPELQQHLTPEQLKERERFVVPLQVIINPKLFVEEEQGVAEFFEGCLSVPNLFGIVPRAKAVRVDCLNEKGEPVILHARGWYARILQHEVDHLNGVVFLERAKTRSLMTRENFQKKWMHRSIQDVEREMSP